MPGVGVISVWHVGGSLPQESNTCGKKSFYFLLFVRRKGEGSEGHDKTTQVMMLISWSPFHEKFIPRVFG